MRPRVDAAEVVVGHLHAAIVADDEVLARANRDFRIVPRRALLHVRLDQRRAVHFDDAVDDGDPLGRQGDDALDVEHAGTGQTDGDDVAALRRTERVDRSG